MNSSFEYITSLEYRLKAARTEIQAFKSGEKYVRMQNEYQKEIRCLKRIIRNLKEELSEARSTVITIRNQWFEVFEEQQRHEIYELKIKLEEETGKNLKLQAQLNRNYENSSIPSSKS